MKPTDPTPFDIASLVYIKPGMLPKDDARPYIVMGHSRSWPFGWTVEIVLAETPSATAMPIPAHWIEQAPQPSRGAFRLTPTGHVLRSVNGERSR